MRLTWQDKGKAAEPLKNTRMLFYISILGRRESAHQRIVLAKLENNEKIETRFFIA